MESMHRCDVADLLAWWSVETSIRPSFTADQLRSIAVPTLVVGGDSDPIIPLEQTLSLYDRLPRSRLCIFPGVGHGIPHRSSEMFNQVVMQFLADIEAERAEG
jgi:pimeloyl-ACP methyl ester carboxylesterase